MKYKIGDILKVKKGHEEKCTMFFNLPNAKYIKIVYVHPGYYSYFILDSKLNVIDSCSCFKDTDLIPVTKSSKPKEKVKYLLVWKRDNLLLSGVEYIGFYDSLEEAKETLLQHASKCLCPYKEYSIYEISKKFVIKPINQVELKEVDL